MDTQARTDMEIFRMRRVKPLGAAGAFVGPAPAAGYVVDAGGAPEIGWRAGQDQGGDGREGIRQGITSGRSGPGNPGVHGEIAPEVSGPHGRSRSWARLAGYLTDIKIGVGVHPGGGQSSCEGRSAEVGGAGDRDRRRGGTLDTMVHAWSAAVRGIDDSGPRRSTGEGDAHRRAVKSPLWREFHVFHQAGVTTAIGRSRCGDCQIAALC